VVNSAEPVATTAVGYVCGALSPPPPCCFPQENIASNTIVAPLKYIFIYTFTLLLLIFYQDVFLLKKPPCKMRANVCHIHDMQMIPQIQNEKESAYHEKAEIVRRDGSV
jgi:hypothetical protein